MDLSVFNAALDVLVSGSDEILTSLVAVAIAYLPDLLARFGKFIPIPTYLRVLIGAGLDKLLLPLAERAVLAAEEHGQRLVKQQIQLAKEKLATIKLDRAREVIRQRVPDFILSDADVDRLIDAALVRLGFGATTLVQFTVETIDKKVDAFPKPGDAPAV